MFQTRKPLSIYIHIPFCRKRCGYCDFNTYAGLDYLQDAYVESLIREAQIASERILDENVVQTVFFGGGTPSHLGAKSIGKILHSLRKFYKFTDDVEISLEMNPWASSADEFFQYHKLGINRLSIGMQSAVEGELRVLSRGHNQNQVEVCVKSAQKAGIFNINLDLIFGIPGQTLSSFKRSLELAFALHPMHLSLYALSIEEGTPLAKLIEQGEISSPDPDLAADMYEYAMDYLELRGFVHYEISNWALGEKNLCRHNLQYWKNKDYLGFGAGAHSLLNGRRWSDVSQIPLYISALSQIKEKSFVISPAEENVINLSQNDKITDTMIMGLRLVKEGVCEAEFRNQHGQELDFVFKVQISLLENQGLLEWIGEFPNRYLRLTRNGRLLGNQVFVQFLRDEN